MIYPRVVLAALALTTVGAAPTSAPEKTMTAMSDDELTAKIATVTAAAIKARDDAKIAKEAEYDEIAEHVINKMKKVRATEIDNNVNGCSMNFGEDNKVTCVPAGCNPMCTNGGGGGGGGGGGCFAKDSSTACLLASPAAECEHVLMADLVPGDLVLGRTGATTVVANQHKAVDTIGEMLTFHTADGTVVSMTPDHAVFVDGTLIAAADVQVGSSLSTGVVKKISKGEGSIINPVTADGTIVADGVVAASNPYWIASATIDAPLTRAVVNVVLFTVGDVNSVAAGCMKVVSTLAGVAAAVKVLRSRKASA